MRDAILTQDIPRIMPALTRPMVVGIAALFFMNLVDTWFISLLGTESLAAVGFAMPITLLVMNLSIGLGIAVSALVSQAVGQNDANKIGQRIFASLSLSLLLGGGVAISGLLAHDAIFAWMGADPVLLPDIRQFMIFWWPGAIVILLVMTQNNTLRALGMVKLSSYLLLLGSLLNVLLDPLLIFGVAGWPGLGVGGASLATSLSWAIVAAILLWHQRRHGVLGRFGISLTGLFFIWRRLLVLSVPAMLTNMLVPVAAAILLLLVAPMGAEAIAAFGVGMRLEPFALVITLAATAVLPVFVAQNHAVANDQRIVHALLFAMMRVVLWQSAVVLLFWLLGGVIARQFSTDVQVQAYIVDYIRWLSIGYVGMAIVLVLNSALNALQKPLGSLLLNAVRLLLFYLPGAYLGAYLAGYRGMVMGAAAGQVVLGVAIWWWLWRHPEWLRTRLAQWREHTSTQ